MKNLLKTNSIGGKSNCLAILLIFLCANGLFAQNYRNEKSYIEDFGKNELYVKEALSEYTKSIVNSLSKERTERTLVTIFNKLENINSILLKNDKGIKGDLALRDSFINLNNKTIELFKNKTLMLNDYKEMSQKSLEEINAIFSVKEAQLKNYYATVSGYENAKRDFGLKYDIKIRSFLKKNILEYNAMENFVFYKIGVIDEKYTQSVFENKPEEALASFNYLTTLCDTSLIDIENYKQDISDISLNEFNKKYIVSMKGNNEVLNMYYTSYCKLYNDLEIAKKDSTITDDDYNEIVRNYNAVKNIYLAECVNVQRKKQLMVSKFYVSNSTFLKNNIQFENNYARYTDAD